MIRRIDAICTNVRYDEVMVVSSSDAPGLLEPSDHSLDDVSFAIDFPINVFVGRLVCFGGDDWSD